MAAVSPSRFESIVEGRLARRTPLASGVNGTVVLSSRSEAWTIRIRPGKATLHRGAARWPTTVVEADGSTLHAVMEGSLAGLHAFFDGRLAVRGNVGLALKLDLMFPPERVAAEAIKPGIVVAGGIETFFLEAGPKDAPAVLLLHGLGGTNVSMSPLMVDLARDHRVIAPDLPGFGESEKPIRPYTFPFFAQWAHYLLDALGIERATVMGNSMGGRIAIETALRIPDRIDRLVLLAPSMAWRAFRHFVPVVRVLRPELGAVPIFLPRTQLMWGIRAIFARPDRLPETWLDAAVDEFITVFRDPRGRIAFFSSARQIYLEELSFWDRLRELRTPSLFFWGDRDRLVPSAFARHTIDAVPHARSIILESCGHVPQIEAIDRIAPIIRGFLGTPARVEG
jgi:pimeloyl-ACP methyl ester carboxylesterase